MFEQAFKNIDDVLRKEAGCTTELDYTKQTSWLLFLKYLDGLEQDKADEAKLEGKRYKFWTAHPAEQTDYAPHRDRRESMRDGESASNGEFVNTLLNKPEKPSSPSPRKTG